MDNNIKGSDKAFTNVLIQHNLSVKNDIFLGDSNVLSEMSSITSTLQGSKSTIHEFESKIDDFKGQFEEFQKNRILTTQDMSLQKVELLNNPEEIDIDHDLSFIKVLCEDSLVNCDVHLHLKYVNTRLVYIKLPFPVLIQNYETEGIKQSQIIAGRIAILYNNLRITLSSAYIDIKKYTDYIIADSPFFINDGSIFTDILVDISIKYTGDITSQINKITPMRYSFQNIQENHQPIWMSHSILNANAIMSWIMIKNKIDVFLNISLLVTPTSFFTNTQLIGKLPAKAYKTGVDSVHTACISMRNQYGIKPVQIMLKSDEEDHYFVYIPEKILNVTKNETVNISGYFSYYTPNEQTQDEPFKIHFSARIDASDIYFSNIDIFDSLNINNALFFNHDYTLNFHFGSDSSSIEPITNAVLENEYTFPIDTNQDSLTVYLTITNARQEVVVTSQSQVFQLKENLVDK